MRYPRWTLSTVLTVSATARFSSAFSSPSILVSSRASTHGARRPTPAMRTTTTSSSSALHANVRRLSDPQRELLDQVDIFIFDCDGVIWRVSVGCVCDVFMCLCFVVCLCECVCVGTDGGWCQSECASKSFGSRQVL